MMKYKLPSGKEVSLPSNGDDWQLYTSSMKCTVAATALTRALTQVVIQIDAEAQKGFTPTPRKLLEMFTVIVNPVRDQYVEFGAADSEPRDVAFDAIERAVKKITGADVRVSW